MGDMSLVVFTSDSKEGAKKALDLTKQLDRDGWIELIDYLLASKDEKGHVTVREMDDEVWEKVAAVGVGTSIGVVSGVLGGPAGALAGAAAGAAAGVGSIRLMEKIVQDTSPEGYPQSLEPGSSTLAVVVEERYAERLEEELQKLGTTVRSELKRAEREAEFEASLQRSKEQIRRMQDDINAKLDEARTAAAADKLRMEVDVAARRADLEVRRERLEEHIKAVNAGLKADIQEMTFRLELAGLRARSGIAAGIDSLERQLNHYNDELENLIHDQIETLKAESAELKEKASKASGETKGAIDAHLRSIESALRRQRSKLEASFEDRLLQLKRWFENLRVRSALGRADMRDRFQASLSAARNSLAELKAELRARNREDDHAWAGIRQGFNKAWKDLEDAFERANAERT
jgi:uncharacterized membrane protein